MEVRNRLFFMSNSQFHEDYMLDFKTFNMSLQKIIVINGIKAHYIGCAKVRIDLAANQVVIENKDKSVRTEPVGGYSHYFDMVLEAFDFQRIDVIFIDILKSAIVLSGIGRDGTNQDKVL